jgi:hypothetical protein
MEIAVCVVRQIVQPVSRLLFGDFSVLRTLLLQLFWHLSRALTCKTRKRKALYALLVVNEPADNCTRACLEFHSAHCKRAETEGHRLVCDTYIEHGTSVSGNVRVITCCWLLISGLLLEIYVWPTWPTVGPRPTWELPLIYRWGILVVFWIVNNSI